MEMTLNYSGAFCELRQNELKFVNGGSYPENAYIIFLIMTFLGCSAGIAIDRIHRYGYIVGNYNPQYNPNDITKWGGVCY